MPEQNFSGQLWSGLADAVADIREKVVEEPWFGRVVNERGDAPQWPEAREAEPQPEGLSGEILGPESQPMDTRESAGLLEHGVVLDAQPMNTESSPQWPQATQALTYEPEQERDRSPDIDIDR
jgi:hypothetical protein